MRKISVLLGTAVMIAALALPVYAMGGGMGGGMMGGSGIMGGWGSSLWNSFQQWMNPEQYNNRPGETGRQAQKPDPRYDGASNNLKSEIQRKENELDGLLNEPNPDMGKIRSLHAEIRSLRERLAEEQRYHGPEGGNGTPRYSYPGENNRSFSGSSGMGGGMGMGSGGMMGGYGNNRW